MGREDSGTLEKVVGLGLLGLLLVNSIVNILLVVVHGNIGNMKMRSERKAVSVTVAVAVRGRWA